MEPREADHQFFDALTAGDLAKLEALLTDDFVLIDVMGGSEIDKSALLSAMRSGTLKFLSIVPGESRVKVVGEVAIVVGTTRMRGSFEGNVFETGSRYTHIFVRAGDAWRLTAAQGTRLNQ